MNDLTPTRNSTVSRPISPELSPHLASLLDSDGSPDDAAREIGAYLALREEARGALPALKAVAEWKAGPEGVRAVIGKRFALYPQPERSEGEWAAWWADYEEVLQDVPLASVEAAMRAWVARPSSEFLPKPGQLHELAYTTVSKTLRRYQRAKRALQLADEPETARPALPEGVAVDNAAKIREMLAEFQAKSIPKVAKAAVTNTAGKADETGITPELRAVLQRQRGIA
jgi:hypothetical protein